MPTGSPRTMRMIWPLDGGGAAGVISDNGLEVISVDRNSRGEEGLGRAALLIAEGVRINAT